MSKGVVEPRYIEGRAARGLSIVRRSQSYRGSVSVEPEIESVKQRGDRPVLVMHDGVTMSIFAQMIPMSASHALKALGLTDV